ncbi:MAG: LptF/LptG family permease, partial [Bacteroidota bacterium]
MLKTLDLYIIKKYLGTFLFVVLIFSMVSVIIDFSQNVEEFIDEKLPAGKVAKEYYLNFVLFINGLLFPLFALISVIFFTSRMAFNSEVISILNAGVSFRRFMRPYLVAAGIIASAHLVASHFLIPLSNKTRLNFTYSYIEKEKGRGSKTHDIHMFIAPDTKIYVRDYRQDSSATHLRLEKFEGNRLTAFLEADEARWQTKTKSWLLTNYEIHTFDSLKESIVVGGKEKLDTVIALHPKDFVRYEASREMVPSGQLGKFIREEKLRGISNTKLYEIELYRRTADPVTILIVTLIGMAVASRKIRGGMGLHLALGVGLGAIFVFLAKFSITFATNEALPAVVG